MFEPKKRQNLCFTVLIILLLSSVIFAFCYSIFFSGSKAIIMVDCTSTNSDQPQQLSGWKTSLYSASISISSISDNVADNLVRSFSIKSLADSTSENSVYFHIQKSNDDFITGAKSEIEVCNKNNQTQYYGTTKTADIAAAGKTSNGLYLYLNGRSYMPTKVGDYRVDGYLFVDGVWHLTNRMNIQLTD
jgi:hypothetical protein